MRICVVGPVYPFKGGISHYTGMMVRNLKKEHEVITVSYKMQYPKILFKKEQRDFTNDSFKIDDAQFLLNTANPFNIIGTANKIKKMNPDLVIIQWWHPYFAPCYKILKTCLGKIKTIYVCHNVFPHERFPMDKFLTRMVLKKGDGFIIHSSKEAEDLLGINKNSKYEVTPHPTYNAFKLQGMSKEDGRSLIGMDNDRKMLLFFGFVREYKGLKHILNAMPAILKENSDLDLYVVGDFDVDKDIYVDMIDNLGVAGQVKIIDGYVPDKEVEKYFAACDLVVLPYESATQSGIVQVAYGFDKPCVVTNVGGLPEVVLDGKTGYVVEPYKPDELARVVNKYFAENNEAEFSANVKAEAYRFSWDRMNEVVARLAQKVK